MLYDKILFNSLIRLIVTSTSLLFSGNTEKSRSSSREKDKEKDKDAEREKAGEKERDKDKDREKEKTKEKEIESEKDRSSKEKEKSSTEISKERNARKLRPHSPLSDGMTLCSILQSHSFCTFLFNRDKTLAAF